MTRPTWLPSTSEPSRLRGPSLKRFSSEKEASEDATEKPIAEAIGEAIKEAIEGPIERDAAAKSPALWACMQGVRWGEKRCRKTAVHKRGKGTLPNRGGGAWGLRLSRRTRLSAATHTSERRRDAIVLGDD